MSIAIIPKYIEYGIGNPEKGETLQLLAWDSFGIFFEVYG